MRQRISGRVSVDGGGGVGGDGDHGAVARLGDGVAGGLGGAGEGVGQRGVSVVGGIGSRVGGEPGGEAAQPLRADHARAAASAQQRGGGGGGGDFVGRGVVRGAIERLAGGGEGAAQVGAGVAVGDGEDVDQVQRLAVQGDPGRRRPGSCA